MNAKQFAKQAKLVIVEENTRIYSELFENTEDASDPYWIQALSLCKSLDTDQRNTLLEIMRQTTIDSVANVFATIDGAIWLEGQDEEFVMTCGSDNLAGNLNDYFLAQFEE